MECCSGQAAMGYANHDNLWRGVELLIPLLTAREDCAGQPGAQHHVPLQEFLHMMPQRS